MDTTVFDHLNAEYETAWLAEVFVPPQEFRAMGSRRPSVIYGRRGAGKTALRLQLSAQASQMNFLVAEWQLDSRGTELLASAQRANQFVRLGIRGCLDALVAHLAQHPQRLAGADSYTHESLAWLMQQFSRAGSHDLQMSLRRLKRQWGEAGVNPLEDLLHMPVPAVLRDDASGDEVITELTSMAQAFNIAGFWLTIDGTERWLDAGAGQAADVLNTLLASLMTFEHEQFIPKLFLPDVYFPLLRDVSARNRLELRQISWSDGDLIQIVNLRLSKALNCTGATLAKIVENSKDVLVWLQGNGGGVPKGWLTLLQPLVLAFAEQAPTPLTAQQALEIQRRHPPTLRVEPAMPNQPWRRVYKGFTEMQALSPGSRKMLIYLYDRHPSLCSRTELYFRVCEDKSEMPAEVDDARFALEKNQNSKVDMAIKRLREAIEPDTSNPIYVINEPGFGFRLSHVK